MAKKTDDKKDDVTKAMSDAMAQMQKMSMSSMDWMGGDWMQRMNALGSEMMHFMAERMQRDIELQQKLLQCRDPKEFQKLQAEFMQNAIDRYTEETGKLMEMTAKAMTPPDPKADS